MGLLDTALTRLPFYLVLVPTVSIYILLCLYIDAELPFSLHAATYHIMSPQQSKLFRLPPSLYLSLPTP